MAAVVSAIVLAGATYWIIARSNQAFGLACAALVAVVTILKVGIPPNATTAWSTGAKGEEATARFLAPLADEGFVIFHDRKIPGSRANIDHFVIGPTGVFVIETKNVAGKLSIDGGDLRIGGRRVAAIDEVLREADAIGTALADLLAPLHVEVRAIVCAHRADLPWFRREVRGVRIVSGRALASLIRKAPTVLSDDQVLELSRLAVRRLPI